MSRLLKIAGLWVAVVVLTASGTAVFAQGPGGMPGVPMQRLGPSRGPGVGLGTPGAPLARMGRGGGIPQAPAQTRPSYGGIAGMPGVLSSQNFRASNFAGQARTGGMMRSSSGIISGATRGAVTAPSGPR